MAEGTARLAPTLVIATSLVLGIAPGARAHSMLFNTTGSQRPVAWASVDSVLASKQGPDPLSTFPFSDAAAVPSSAIGCSSGVPGPEVPPGEGSASASFTIDHGHPSDTISKWSFEETLSTSASASGPAANDLRPWGCASVRSQFRTRWVFGIGAPTPFTFTGETSSDSNAPVLVQLHGDDPGTSSVNYFWEANEGPHTVGGTLPEGLYVLVTSAESAAGVGGCRCEDDGGNIVPDTTSSSDSAHAAMTLTLGAAPGFSIDDATTLEGDSGTTPLSFQVSLPGPASAPVSIDYATAAVDATEGTDYQGASGTLSFATGEQQKTISVDVIGDTDDEDDESFEVRLSNPVGTGVADGTGVGTIRDDDDPGLLPVIFIPGFAGSTLWCDGGTNELWPNIPFPALLNLRLNVDGVTNAGCPDAGPKPGDLVLSAGGGDIYGRAVNFVHQLAPGRSYLYAWDWRRGPEDAMANLDALVERARCGGEASCAEPMFEKVVIMAHSYGGLVTRLYIDDPARAAKVERAVTVGTPYWGAPKAIFPLAAGIEAPDFSALDVMFINSSFRAFARTLTGNYFLFPTPYFGPWLQVDGHGTGDLDATGLAAWVDELGGVPALLERAQSVHATNLDGFKRNGVAYRVVVGTGLPTIQHVHFGTAEADTVRVLYGNGDGTVPARSAVQGTPGTADPLGENVPISYVCGVSHVPLPGEDSVTLRVTGFLLNGAPISPGAPCPAGGYELDFDVDLVGRAAEPARSTGPSLSLEAAEQQGLIDLLQLPRQTLAVTHDTAPVELTVPATAPLTLRASRLLDETRSAAGTWTGLSGNLLIRAGAGTLAVLRDGVPVAPDGALPRRHGCASPSSAGAARAGGPSRARSRGPASPAPTASGSQCASAVAA